MRLSAENLAGERGGEAVFENIDFALGAGEGLVVTGPNGSGKSTLLRVLAGLLPSAGGKVQLHGGGDTWPNVASACHYLGHGDALKTALTVVENLTFWRELLGEKRLSVADALDEVGLPFVGRLPCGYLSTGQKRRVAIARLLVSHRPVWLLDEPTAGLDKASEARFASLMEAHMAAGGMVVAATHLPLGLENVQTLLMGGQAG